MRNFRTNVVIGAVAGLAAAGAMSGFQALWLKQRPSRNMFRPRTDVEVMKLVAGRAGRSVGLRLSRKEREFAALLLHYGFGAVVGAMYVTLVEQRKVAGVGRGAVFGTAFYVAGDTFSPRSLKPKVENSETISRIYEWMTHVVYGVTLEAGRRGAKALLKTAA